MIAPSFVFLMLNWGVIALQFLLRSFRVQSVNLNTLPLATEQYYESIFFTGGRRGGVGKVAEFQRS